MNINSISNMNFSARISRKDYHMGQIEDFLFFNNGIGADEIMDFHGKLSQLPDGDIVIDEFVQHAGKSYVFGSIYPNCNHRKPFIAETHDSDNLLAEIYNAIKNTFNCKSDNPDCPICNPNKH